MTEWIMTQKGKTEQYTITCIGGKYSLSSIFGEKLGSGRSEFSHRYDDELSFVEAMAKISDQHSEALKMKVED